MSTKAILIRRIICGILLAAILIFVACLIFVPRLSDTLFFKDKYNNAHTIDEQGRLKPLETLVNETLTVKVEEESEEYEAKLWIDTVMYAAGHSFGYEGDITMWGGWYFDTIPVGDDIMLSYDSVGPRKLKLILVSRELIVDMADPNAPDEIKAFLGPLKGFKRFHQDYEEILDSIGDEEHPLTCTGYYSFTADYADTCTQKAELINKFLYDLSGISKSEKTKVHGLSNIKNLSDFLANRAFENWKRGGDTNESSNAEKREIRLHVYNHNFVTYSIYEYDRIGIGHGMYTAHFSTLNLSAGKKLTNKSIFKPNAVEEVKKLLFETMFNDKRYREWNKEIESPEEIEAIIYGCQSPGGLLEGTEWEERKKEIKFELPEGALTVSGVVFSFQPYEIDCWAAGAFHFIVPYEKLMPYLTQETKTLISSYI